VGRPEIAFLDYGGQGVTFHQKGRRTVGGGGSDFLRVGGGGELLRENAMSGTSVGKKGPPQEWQAGKGGPGMRKKKGWGVSGKSSRKKRGEVISLSTERKESAYKGSSSACPCPRTWTCAPRRNEMETSAWGRRREADMSEFKAGGN